MSPEQMRAKIRKAYPGEKWFNKVDKMSDKQVYCIYMRLLSKKQL